MADNPFNIALKQLRSEEISGYLVSVLNNNFTGLANSYLAGANIAHLTGIETFTEQKTFVENPNVPYSGATGQAPSRLYVDYSGLQLQLQLNTLVNLMHISGSEYVSGEKIFNKILINSGRFTGVCEVPYPANNSGAISLEYLNNQIGILNGDSFVKTSGDQVVSGIKSFFNGGSVYLPTATQPSGGVPLSQLTSTGTHILNVLAAADTSLQNQITAITLTGLANITGFAGVAAINGVSGFIFTQGRGTITTTQNGNILSISGHSFQPYTGAFLGHVNVLSGVDRQFISYGNSYAAVPYVFTQLESPSGNPQLPYYVSGRSSNGFNVIYSGTVNHSGYAISYFGWTGSGSVINVIQGPQGVSGLSGASIVGPEGPAGVFINSGTITGNFYTSSYFLDIVYTGVDLVNSFVFRPTVITGWQIACGTTGRGGAHLNSGSSGIVLQRELTGSINKIDTSNNSTFMGGFSLNSGQIYNSGSYLFNIPAYNRISINILSGLSGLSNLTIGLAGY